MIRGIDRAHDIECGPSSYRNHDRADSIVSVVDWRVG